MREEKIKNIKMKKMDEVRPTTNHEIADTCGVIHAAALILLSAA